VQDDDEHNTEQWQDAEVAMYPLLNRRDLTFVVSGCPKVRSPRASPGRLTQSVTRTRTHLYRTEVRIEKPAGDWAARADGLSGPSWKSPVEFCKLPR